jgi:ABC-type antimicrobial peptide transport system permease subunit
MALGTQRAGVLRSVFLGSLSLVMLGVVIDIALALWLTILSMLFGVVAHDPLRIFSVAALMLFVAALSGYLPARRASRVDRMIALREE